MFTTALGEMSLKKYEITFGATARYEFIVFRFVQPENTGSFILVNPLGSVTLVKLEHPANAFKPMLVTLFGIDMPVKPLLAKCTAFYFR